MQLGSQVMSSPHCDQMLQVDGNSQGGKQVGRWANMKVFLVRSCLLITLVKCLKTHKAPGRMFLISSLAHVINTCASTCMQYMCQHMQYTLVLACVLYTRASTCIFYTCQHMYILHVLAQCHVCLKKKLPSDYD